MMRPRSTTSFYRDGFFIVFGFSGPRVCVFITAVPNSKLFAWGEGDRGGHVLRETISQGLSYEEEDTCVSYEEEDTCMCCERQLVKACFH